MPRTFLKVIAAGELDKSQGKNPTVEDEDYSVPEGKTLRLTRFSGGHEYSEKEVRVELVWEGSVLAVGYGGSFQIDMDEDLEGPGTLTIRRVNGDKELHISAWWEGMTYTNG